MAYYIHYMVYRMGQRARFYRLRRVGFFWQVQPVLTVLGLCFVSVLGLAASSPQQALQLVGMHRMSTHKAAGNDKTTTAARNAKAGSSKQPPKNTAASIPTATQSAVLGLRTAGCSDFPARTPGLATAPSSELQKLAQYEQVCNGRLTQRSSFFVPTPATTVQAQEYANDVVNDLKTYAQYGIAPLVFMEPDTATGDNLDLVQYQNGAYDAALDTYFAAIKAAGVTDAMMGMWVMLPEGNMPSWTSVDPSVFAADVTKVAGFQKKYFPASQTTILLDSETYPSADSWNGGAYISLLPYVQGIPKGLLDSFGLQGFPWSPPANQSGPSLSDPKTYLRVDFAAAAARTLGVSNIWLNTGTFSRAYTNNAAERVADSATQRQAMLGGVVVQAQTLQAQGFTVSVHIFAQDKSVTTEAIDWSYWKIPGDAADTSVFTTFVHDIANSHITLWLFDTF